MVELYTCKQETLRPGPSCSKLTMLLVNVLSKFQMFHISEICQYFLLKKMCEAFAEQKLLSLF